MNTQTTRQEILLLTGSELSKRQYCEKLQETFSHTSLSSSELLEKACWDGLLPEILPGVIDKNCFTWKIVSAEKFICISLGPYPEPVPSETTINPFSLLRNSSLNQ